MDTNSSFRALVRSDIAVWLDMWKPWMVGSYGPRYLLAAAHMIYQAAGLRAALLYRAGHALHRRRITALPQVISQLNLMLHGFDVPSGVEIGPGLYIPHPVGTVVMAKRLGAGVTLVSGVTVGMRHEPVFPTIGNNVYLGAGARVLGDITIGDNVSVGANAVVLTDVPDNCIAVGVPATIRPAKGHGTTPVPATPPAQQQPA